MQGIIEDLNAADKPQILVLNKADAVGADPEIAARAAATDWLSLHDAVTPCEVVATSARDGRGLDKLQDAVENALLKVRLQRISRLIHLARRAFFGQLTCASSMCCSQMAIEINCVLPYAEAALLAELHKSSTITCEEYVEEGTKVAAHVPFSLRNRIEKACMKAGTEFTVGGTTGT